MTLSRQQSLLPHLQLQLQPVQHVLICAVFCDQYDVFTGSEHPDCTCLTSKHIKSGLSNVVLDARCGQELCLISKWLTVPDI